ncbi:MAG: aspartate aminotransferase family protein [Bacteriovoracia bacterium]
MVDLKKGVQYPEGNVLLRNLQKRLPVVSHGERMFLFDHSGKRYIDASGGALVTSLGHGCREVVEAISQQMTKVAYVNGTQFTNEPAEQLAARLVEYAKPLTGGSAGALNRAAFLGSGSEAVEAAVKFARQLWVERGKPGRAKVIARTPGYHGNTLFALSASGRPHYQKYYGPLLTAVRLIPSTYEYRSAVTDYARDGGEHYANLLEQAILEEGPETVAAFFVEPIIGSSAGASVPPPGYFDRVMTICRKYDVLMIADEVMCGSGRSGPFFASEHFGFQPDILLLGKGVSGGYIPLSAVMVKSSHLDEMKRGSGYFMHAQTFLQSPSIAAAGVATLAYYDRHQVLANGRQIGARLHELLATQVASHPNVGFVTGRGPFAGVEFVEDKATKRPFERAKKVAENFVAHAFDRGLIVWPNIGQADGVNGDLVMLGPPLNSSAAEIDELVDTLAKVIASFFKK